MKAQQAAATQRRYSRKAVKWSMAVGYGIAIGTVLGTVVGVAAKNYLFVYVGMVLGAAIGAVFRTKQTIKSIATCAAVALTTVVVAVVSSPFVRAADEKGEKPLSPETILERNFEGPATVELEVGEVHTLNINALSVPDVSHVLQINAKIPGAKIGQQVLVIVSREVATRLLKLGIADPAEHFRGKILRVSGTVELIRRPSAPRPASNPAGAPSQMLYRIRVTNLDQLESIRNP